MAVNGGNARVCFALASLMRPAHALLSMTLVLSVATTVGAQEASDASVVSASVSDEEARLRFEAGRVAFAAGRNEEALADFRRAYELSHRPALLYNIGVTLDRMRRDADALEHFERYLAETPSEGVSNRGEVEARIVILREAVAREAAAREEEQSVRPAVQAPRSDAPDPGGVALAIVGGALVFGGAGVSIAGSMDRARVDAAMPPAMWIDYADAAARAPILEGSGAAAAGVGVALAIAGIVILTMPTDRRETARLRISPRGFSLVVRF